MLKFQNHVPCEKKTAWVESAYKQNIIEKWLECWFIFCSILYICHPLPCYHRHKNRFDT